MTTTSAASASPEADDLGPDVTSPAEPDSPIALFAVLFAVVGLSTGTTLIKSIHLPGPVTGFWRLLFGAVGWHVAMRVRRRPFTRQDLRRTLVPGLFFGANLACFYTGVTRTAIAHAEFLGVLSPLIVIPLAARRLGERTRPSTLGFGAVALVGVLTIIVFSSRNGGNASVGGDVLVLCGVGLWANYLLLAKKIRATMSTDAFMGGMTFWACVLMAPFAFVTHRITDIRPSAWFVIVVMAFISGMVSHGLLAYAQGHVPVGVITLLQLGQPPLGVLWARIFLGETVRPLQIAGMALVLSAVAGVAVNAARKPASVTQSSRT